MQYRKQQSIKLKMIGLTKKSPTFSKKSALKRGRRQRQTVSFARNGDGMETVTVRTIPDLSDYTDEEKYNAWYTDADFKMMKFGIVQLLRQVVAGTYLHEIGSLESEARGLETKTPEGSKQRKGNRIAAMFAVLDEQDRQREHGMVDPEYIAQLYKQSSAHCQAKAIETAANDSSIIQGERPAYDTKAIQKLLQPPASPSRPSLARSIVASPIKSLSRRRLLSMMIAK